MIAGFSPIWAIEIVFFFSACFEKNKTCGYGGKSLRKPRGGSEKGKNFPGICPVNLRTNEHYDRCLKTRSRCLNQQAHPNWKAPKFSVEELVLALMAVVRRKHFPELLGQFL